MLHHWRASIAWHESCLSFRVKKDYRLNASTTFIIVYKEQWIWTTLIAIKSISWLFSRKNTISEKIYTLVVRTFKHIGKLSLTNSIFKHCFRQHTYLLAHWPEVRCPFPIRLYPRRWVHCQGQYANLWVNTKKN